MRIIALILSLAWCVTAPAQVLVDHYKFGSLSESNALLTGLQVMFEANESSGNLLDSSGLGEHMTVNDPVANEVNGKVLTARSFGNAGYEDYFSIAANAQWNTLSNGNFTIAMWLKVGADAINGGDQYIMGKADLGDGDVDWILRTDGTAATYVDGVDIEFIAQNAALGAVNLRVPFFQGDSEWHFVVIQRSSDAWSMFVAPESDLLINTYTDTDDSSGTPGFEISNGVGTFFIGNMYDSTDPDLINPFGNFTGKIDNVGFWNVALTECQLYKLFGLRGYEQFDADAGDCSGGGGGGATYLFEENFEGTGYENSWTESGATVEEDDTTAPAPLEGSHSLRITTSGAVGNTISTTFTAEDDAWFYFKLRPVTVGSTAAVIAELRSAAAECVRIRTQSDGRLGVRAGGGTEINTVSTIASGSTYHVWVHFVKGTGSDAVGTVAFSTDGTKPTSGNAFAQSTNGTATTDTDRIRLGAGASTTYELIYDMVRIDDATIGDNPL